MSGWTEAIIWALCGIATFTDLRWGKVYNNLTLPALTLGILFNAFYFGWTAGGSALLAAVLIFILFFPFYWLRAFAAGDIKLLMALAAWGGFLFAARVSFLGVLLGAVVGLLVILKQKGWKSALQDLFSHLQGEGMRSGRSTKMPFAPAFFGALILMKIMEVKRWNLLPF